MPLSSTQKKVQSPTDGGVVFKQVMVVKFSQPSKAPSPMEVTVFGMVTLDSLPCLKAPLLMDTTPSGMEMLSVLPAGQEISVALSLLYKMPSTEQKLLLALLTSIVVRLELSEKTLCPIAETELGRMTVERHLNSVQMPF